MSNLSDLLPAGAGAKSATFTASGTLATGTTVALQSDGTVKEISATAIPETLGSATALSSPSSLDTVYVSAYDSANNAIVVPFRDPNDSFRGKAVVFTQSGTTTSVGTPVTFTSSTIYLAFGIVYDSNAGKVAIMYSDITNSSYIYCVVGTVSGASISFGTPVVAYSSGVSWGDQTGDDNVGAVFDSANNKVVFTFRDSSDQPRSIVGTISGTSISFGTSNLVNGQNSGQIASAYDVSAGKVIIAVDNNITGTGQLFAGTVSGTSITHASQTAFNGPQTVSDIGLTYVPDANLSVLVYRDVGGGSVGEAKTISYSGSSFTQGTTVTFGGSGAKEWNRVAYDSSAGKLVVAFRDAGDSNYGNYVVGTISGTDLTFGTQTRFEAASTNKITLSYNSTEQVTFIGYDDVGNSQRLTGISLQNSASNVADFVGITDQAIADTATGSVVVEGGVITNSSLNIATTVSVGATNEFDTSVAHNGITYDTNSDKIVNTYRDDNNSFYGTAIVGTQSGTSFTYGTPVVFESVNSQYTRPVFDSGNNKVVVCYRDATNSRGRAVVGTVSGTSISFGTAATFDSNSPYLISAAYDSNAGKVVAAYSPILASEHGTAVVGTVSGTSISFGTPVVFEAAQTAEIATVYDSTNNKIVIGYNDDASGDNPTAIVGTVSGTSISFGSPVVIQSTDIADIGGTFDSTNGKVVFVYKDQTNSNYGTAAIGTVSGTSISFGTPVVYSESNSLYNEAAYDSSAGAVVVVYQDAGDSAKGKVVAGVVSGTSISFNSATTFDSNNVVYLFAVYNPDEEDVVIGYQGNSNGQNVAVTTTTTMTTGSTYYVQDDGSLSTTSSSVTAGKALSSTTLLLKG
jgi:hypothetical protein